MEKLVEYKERKALDIKYSGRSSDYITPSYIWGCLAACSYCVKHDSKIIMANGLELSIDKIQDGSLITSYNTNNQSIQEDRVLEVASREVDEIYRIEVQGQILEVTAEHPFYTKNRGWVKAQDLNNNDELLCDISHKQ